MVIIDLTDNQTKKTVNDEIWPKSTLIKSSVNQTIILSSEYAVMPQTKPLKKSINLPMFATIFVVSYYKPPTVWKLRGQRIIAHHR